MEHVDVFVIYLDNCSKVVKSLKPVSNKLRNLLRINRH